MGTNRYWRKIIFLFVCAIFVAGVFFLKSTDSVAMQDELKKVDHQQAYRLYEKSCLGCHDSVADPEKPGKTRDEWYLVVNLMHNYGLVLSPKESDQIIDLLYDLRKGLEKQAG